MKLSPSLISILLIIGQVCRSEGHQNTAQIDIELTAQIDNFITNHYFPNAGITGLGLSIVKITDDGQALYSNGYGMADQEKGIPNGNQTQFLIASITKSFTATVVVKILHERFPQMGEAVLDTPIRKLIPYVNFTLTDRFRSEHGTFRDLLAHRMCYRRGDIAGLIAQSLNTASEIVFRQRYAEERCGIRSEFQYNNQMYVMAGELIAIIANKSYEALIEDLLTQIGMLNSTLSKKSDHYSNLPFRAKPYYILDNVSHPTNTALLARTIGINAAAGLWSTPDDMAKYLSFHLNLGKVGDNQVIPKSVMKWLTRPSNLIPQNKFKSTEEEKQFNHISYGLGLYRASYDGWEYVWHDGFVPPFNSLLSLFPSQKIGIFTTSNQSPALIEQPILHAYIFEILRGSPNALEISSNLVVREKVRRAEFKVKLDKIVAKFLDQVEDGRCRKGSMSNLPNITGIYGSGSLGNLKIFEKLNPETNSTGLYLLYGKWAHGWLEAYSSSTNDTAEVFNLKIKWDTDLVQDNYANGMFVGIKYARVYNDSFEFLWPLEDKMHPFGIFRAGLSLENLPAIPWKEDSC